jgi:hypothetical protein
MKIPVLNQAPCHELIWENGGIAPCIINVGTKWRWRASFIPWPIHYLPTIPFWNVFHACFLWQIVKYRFIFTYTSFISMSYITAFMQNRIILSRLDNCFWSPSPNTVKPQFKGYWVFLYLRHNFGGPGWSSIYLMYKGHLQSTWTHIITPSQNFVEVQWWFLFQSTSLGKQWTSYDAPPTSQKCATDCWSLWNFPQSSLFMVGKVQTSHGARSGLYGRCSNGVPPIQFFQAEQRIQF